MTFDLVKFIKINSESLDKIFDLIPVPIFTKDIQGRYLTCNTAFESFSGLTRQQMLGKSVYDLWPREQADIYYVKDRELFENAELQVYEAGVTTPSGQEYVVQFHKTTFLDADGKIAGLLGAVFDLTEKKKLEQALYKIAQTDELTGLPNRREGIRQMERTLKQSVGENCRFGVATIDFDHFKKINDTYGHDGGDHVLKSIKRISSSVLRQSDILFRLGGEEFVLCLPDTSLEMTQMVAERLRAAFAAQSVITPKGDEVRFTVSIGTAAYPDHGDDIFQVLRASDEALYLAKNSGRNCVIAAEKDEVSDDDNSPTCVVKTIYEPASAE